MISNEYKNRIAILDQKTCVLCKLEHGKIYPAEEHIETIPPLHPKCRCVIEWMDALYAGTATQKGRDGADWWLKFTGKLPDYYITNLEAKRKDYEAHLGNLATVAPGKMITRGIYSNRNGHLPTVSGRVWYEADINYNGGFRGSERILFSNDGLVFVTYDHYQTFHVIV